CAEHECRAHDVLFLHPRDSHDRSHRRDDSRRNGDHVYDVYEWLGRRCASSVQRYSWCLMIGGGTSVDPIPPPGTILSHKYRVDRLLGKGGMGYVIAATHVQLDEAVAMKFLHPTVAQDPELVGRFVREAKAALKIRSEHVVKVLDVGTLAP